LVANLRRADISGRLAFEPSSDASQYPLEREGDSLRRGSDPDPLLGPNVLLKIPIIEVARSGKLLPIFDIRSLA
jgi:hypothetical protein